MRRTETLGVGDLINGLGKISAMYLVSFSEEEKEGAVQGFQEREMGRKRLFSEYCTTPRLSPLWVC